MTTYYSPPPKKPKPNYGSMGPDYGLQQRFKKAGHSKEAYDQFIQARDNQGSDAWSKSQGEQNGVDPGYHAKRGRKHVQRRQPSASSVPQMSAYRQPAAKVAPTQQKQTQPPATSIKLPSQQAPKKPAAEDTIRELAGTKPTAVKKKPQPEDKIRELLPTKQEAVNAEPVFQFADPETEWGKRMVDALESRGLSNNVDYEKILSDWGHGGTSSQQRMYDLNRVFPGPKNSAQYDPDYALPEEIQRQVAAGAKLSDLQKQWQDADSIMGLKESHDAARERSRLHELGHLLEEPAEGLRGGWSNLSGVRQQRTTQDGGKLIPFRPWETLYGVNPYLYPKSPFFDRELYDETVQGLGRNRATVGYLPNLNPR